MKEPVVIDTLLPHPRLSPISGILRACLRAVVLSLVVCFFAGCARTFNIRSDILPTSSTSAMMQQWPLTVGVFVPPSVKSRVFANQGWRVHVGEAAASSFRWAVGQMFTVVVDLDTAPSGGSVPVGLAGVIELSDISLTYSMPRALHYDIRLYSSKGETISRWSLTAQELNWDVKESSLSSLMQSVGSSLSYCIRDATAQFMVSFSRSFEVQSWLASEDVKISAPHPVWSDPESPTEHPSLVLLVPNLSTWLYSDTSRGMNCVGNWLSQSSPPIKVIPVDIVRLQFFPWLEMSTAPKTLEQLQSWLSEPAVQQKLRAIGARYLLEFQGATKTEVPNGGIACGAGPWGGGCLGFSWGDRESSFSATILDMWTGSKLSEAKATQHSDVYVPAFGLPVPIFTPTEAKACEELARRIHDIIMQNQP